MLGGLLSSTTAVFPCCGARAVVLLLVGLPPHSGEALGWLLCWVACCAFLLRACPVSVLGWLVGCCVLSCLLVLFVRGAGCSPPLGDRLQCATPSVPVRLA